MLNITIVTIPHKEQRYPTVGDWVVDYNKNSHTIYVSDMNNWKYEFCVAVHELVEMFYCLACGVTQQRVDTFDMQYEKNRKKDDKSEPGDCPRAPYHKQHKFATFVERAVAFVLDVNWETYEKVIDSLY